MFLGSVSMGVKRGGEEGRTIFVPSVEDYTGDDAVVDSLLDDGFKIVGWCHSW